MIRRLRNDERTSAIPIVVFSADALSSQTEECINAGANDYLIKPLDLPHFLSVIDSYLH